MRFKLFIITLIIVISIASFGFYYGFRAAIELPTKDQMPNLHSSDISEKISSGNIESVLIDFLIQSPIYRYHGFIFDSGICLYEEQVGTGQTLKYINDYRQLGFEDDPSPEFMAILASAPDGDYTYYVEACLEKGRIIDFMNLLSQMEIDINNYEGSTTCITYIVNIYIDNKAAGYKGQLHSGTNGINQTRYENMNREIYNYLVGSLIPYLKLNAEMIDNSALFYDQEIEYLKNYPFAIVYNKDNADQLVMGDLNLWKK